MVADRLAKQVERYLRTDIQYLLRGASWAGVSQSVSAVAAFATAVAFANLLPPNDYGMYKYVLSALGLLAILSLPGLATAVLQAAARGFSGSLFPALRIRFLFSLLALGAGAAIGLYYFLRGNSELATLFFLIAAFIPLFEPLTLSQAVLQGKHQFRKVAEYTSVTSVFSAGAMIAVLLFSDDVLLIVAAFLGATALGRLFRLRDAWRIAGQEPADRKAVRFGVHLSFAAALAAAAVNADTLILWHFTDPATLASFAFALATINPAHVFLKSVVNLAHPKMAAANPEVLQKILIPRIARYWLLLVVPVGLLIAAIPFVYELFFPVYKDSAIFAQVMAAGIIFTPNKLLSVALTARQNATPLLQLNALNSTVRIIAFMVLVPLFGVWGAVGATLGTQIVAGLATLFFFKRSGA